MSARQGIFRRIANEELSLRTCCRVLVLAAGYLLTLIVETLGLFRFRIARRVYFGLYAMGKWLFDRDKLTVMQSCLREGSVFIDVGGAYGYFTFKADELVGTTGTVIVLEPDPGCYLFIEDRLNQCQSNIQLHKEAAWHAETELELHICKENRGENSLFRSPIHASSVMIKARKLDSFVDIDQSVDLMKIDVQGAEAAVLQGMKRILSSSPGIAVICECSPADLNLAGVSVDELLTLLINAGFNVFRMDKDLGTKVTQASDLCDLTDRRYGQCDLICYRTETN